MTVSETILEIKVSHKTTAEMAVAYGFTPRQNEQLTLLSDPQYDTLWMTLLGGYVSGGGQIIDPDTDWIGTGIFAWPLPRNFTITSNFGYRQDPFTGELTYHNGTDIAAPQGTPILAAADGTVTIANGIDPWGGSYGYHVKIDHGGGMETLYAHCSAIAVTVGQQVRQGEVIGFVGNTGNSTGNHLHFEVWENGDVYKRQAFVRRSFLLLEGSLSRSKFQKRSASTGSPSFSGSIRGSLYVHFWPSALPWACIFYCGIRQVQK